MDQARTPGFKTISADSHVTEPPNCYIDYIDPKFRDRAPRLTKNKDKGDIFICDGLPIEIPLSVAAAAGRNPEDILNSSRTFDELHRGGWDPKARLLDQDRDGVAAEVVYPTVGMVLCSHPENDYMHASFQAYNRWLKEFCDDGEGRIFGIPQIAINSVDEAIQECADLRKLGFRGVMFPCYPGTNEDYDHPSFERLWAALCDLNMPISFHTFTSKHTRSVGLNARVTRGPQINSFIAITRDNQDLLGLFVWTGIFERFPKLRVVSVEADAGWVPHYINRMDHNYNRHRFWKKGLTFKRMPSEYFLENVYLTFQDDRIAFVLRNELNIRRLLWANDFPHSDSTWPNSQELLAKHTADLTHQERRWVLRDNVAELYDLHHVPA